MAMPVWNIRGTGWSAQDARDCRLALLRLMEPLGSDPLRFNIPLLLARDLMVTSKRARRILYMLQVAGFARVDTERGGTRVTVSSGIERPSY